MNIMYLLYSFTVGGAERLVVDICNEMVNRENNVHLYIVNNMYSNDLLNTIDKRVHIKLQNRKMGRREKIGTILKVSNYIRYNHIDVVHCNAFNAPELLFLKPFLFRNVRIIHTIHDVGQYKKLNTQRVKLRNYLCDKFVAISICVKDDIISCGANATKVEIVYNAINLERFKMDRRAHDDMVIGNVARIMPEKKGQDILIDAIARIIDKYPNIKCYFAGGYDASHEKAFYMLKDKIKKNGLSKNIFFLGNVDDIPRFLAQIDIFVLPSRFEGFGISLIEAMSMGIPCVASNLDGPAEIIGNNERGMLFSPGNIKELADKLTYVIEHYERIMDDQFRIVEYTRSKFSIVEMCNRLMNIYIGG